MMSTSRRRFLAAGAFGALAALAGCEQADDLVAQLLSPESRNDVRPPTGHTIDLETHVLNRMTFGPRPGDRANVAFQGVDAFIEEQLQPQSIMDLGCDLKTAELESINQPRGELYSEDSRVLIDELRRDKLLRAIYSRRQLQEVMVDFWSDHFNIAVNKGDCRWMKVADDREVIRPFALGRFRDLVRASALSPAMLVYLDGHDNKVIHPGDLPNENYARELLELHTLGVGGGYTQEDVMEAARCLSGWTYGSQYRGLLSSVVDFDPARHDSGPKQVLGTEISETDGRKELDAVISLACSHRSTARHIAMKLCRCFVSDPAPEELVHEAAERFLSSDGQIADVLQLIFFHDEFRSRRGNLFKRPQRFVVSALRATDARSDAAGPIQQALERMGHAPFSYPAPDGYPLESAPWMGTLLWRWNFAIDLAAGRLKGTRIDSDGLLAQLGGRKALLAHLLGRVGNETEVSALLATQQPLALSMACPAFQWH